MNGNYCGIICGDSDILLQQMLTIYAPTKAPQRQALHQTAKPRQTSFETARATSNASSHLQSNRNNINRPAHARRF